MSLWEQHCYLDRCRFETMSENYSLSACTLQFCVPYNVATVDTSTRQRQAVYSLKCVVCFWLINLITDLIT